jgi:murein DD-endopeptidase MepM/ murein hydrolase activator NlpD
LQEQLFSRLWAGEDSGAPALATADGIVVKVQHTAVVSGGVIKEWYFTGVGVRCVAI